MSSAAALLTVDFRHSSSVEGTGGTRCGELNEYSLRDVQIQSHGQVITVKVFSLFSLKGRNILSFW